MQEAAPPDVETPELPDHDDPAERVHTPERRCIVTGQVLPRAQLIRCVVGPDQQVWPDLQEKMPGRGLWVSCDAGALTTAIQKNLFAKAAKAPVRAVPDLAIRVRQQLLQRLEQLLGLAKRSGAIIQGFAQVEPAARGGQLAVLFIARDAGADGQAKLKNKMTAAQVITALTSVELGQALGADQLVYVGVQPQALVQQILQAAARFSAFTAQENIAPAASLAQIGAASGQAGTPVFSGDGKSSV